MAETSLIDIKIPTSEIDKAKKAVTQYRTEVEKLKQQNKELKKAEGDYEDQITENTIAIKKYSAELRVNERVLVANEKATDANTGSVEEMRAQLSAVTVQWNKLSKEERENTETGKKLSKQKLELTNELKKVESATGDTRRNVGNYSDGMKEALVSTGQFSVAQKSLAAGQKLYQVAMAGSTNAVRAFTVALAATGLTLVIGLFATLRESLSRTEAGQAKLNKIMGIFGDIMGAVFKVLEPLANFIADQVIKHFETLGTVAGWALDTISKGLKLLGFDEAAESVNNFTNAVEEGVEASQKLNDAEVELNKVRREQRKLQLEFQKDAEKLRQIRDDESKTTAERIAANEKLAETLNKQLQEELKLAQKVLEVSELRIAAEGESTENLDARAEALTEIADIEERITGQQSEQLVNRNALLKEDKEKRKKAEEDALKAQEEAAQAALEAEQERFDQSLENYQKQKEEQILALKNSLIEEQITVEEFNAEMLEIEAENLQLQKELREQFGLDTIEIDNQIADNKLRIIEETKAAEKEGADFQDDLNKETKKSQEQAGKEALATTKSLLKEESGAYKAVASAETLINTYKAAQSAFSSLSGIPIVGPALGAVAAAAAVVSGLANVAKINSANPSFAKGVIGLDGAGTETSDSITANLSRGESVVTAKATRMFAPQIADMERAVGNTPNFQLGNRRFATGIINAGASASVSQAQTEVAQRASITEDFENVQIVTQISDIERVEDQEAEALNVAVIQ